VTSTTVSTGGFGASLLTSFQSVLQGNSAGSSSSGGTPGSGGSSSNTDPFANMTPQQIQAAINNGTFESIPGVMSVSQLASDANYQSTTSSDYQGTPTASQLYFDGKPLSSFGLGPEDPGESILGSGYTYPYITVGSPTGPTISNGQGTAAYNTLADSQEHSAGSIIGPLVGLAAVLISGGTLAPLVADAVGGGLTGAIAGGAVSGAIGGGLSAAISGGDIGKGILGGALTGGIGGGVTSGLTGAGVDTSIAKAVGGAASGATGAAVNGGNPLNGAVSGGVGGAVGGLTGNQALGGLASTLTGNALNVSNPGSAGTNQINAGSGTPNPSGTPTTTPISSPGFNLGVNTKQA